MSVSVVIATHNRAPWLARALDSVLAQTYPLREIIITDNASTDETPDVVADYQRIHPTIRYLRHDDPLAITSNWFAGVHAATGDWVKIVFDDDWLEPDCVEEMLAAAKADTLVVQCGATFEPDGVDTYHRPDRLPLTQLVRSGQLSVSPVTALIRRHALLTGFSMAHTMLSPRCWDSGVGPCVAMVYGPVVTAPYRHVHIPRILVHLGGSDLPGDARSLTYRLRESDPMLLADGHAEAYALLDSLVLQAEHMEDQ